MMEDLTGREEMIHEIEFRLVMCRNWDDWTIEELVVLLLKLMSG
jgi:hypothetical protein